MKQWLGLMSGVVLATTAGAGTVVHIATKSGSDPQKDHEVYYAQGGMLRIDHLDSDGHVDDMTLVRDNTIWKVNVRDRTFTKTDNQAITARMGAMDDRMKAMLDSLPPDKRAMFEQRMQAMKSGTASGVELTDTGHGDHAGSYSCEVWSLTRAGRELSQNCLVQASGIAGGAELADSLEKAVPVVEAALAATPLAPAAQLLVEFKKAHGFPVLVRHMAGGKETSSRLRDRGRDADAAGGQVRDPEGLHGEDDGRAIASTRCAARSAARNARGQRPPPRSRNGASSGRPPAGPSPRPGAARAVFHLSIQRSAARRRAGRGGPAGFFAVHRRSRRRLLLSFRCPTTQRSQ